MRVSLRVVDNEFRAVKRLMYDEGERCTVVCNRQVGTEYLVKRRVDWRRACLPSRRFRPTIVYNGLGKRCPFIGLKRY